MEGYDLLTLAREYQPCVLETALGDLGPRIKEFANGVDCLHPDIHILLGGIFSPQHEINKAMSQLIYLTAYAMTSGRDYSKIVPLLSKLKKGLRIPSEFEELIGDPVKTRNFTRLVSERKKRDEIRYKKEPIVVNLSNFYKKGCVGWTSCPADFSMYQRGSDTYKTELAKAEKIVNRWEKSGSKELLNNVKMPIAEFSATMGETYYGFHRIKLATAAVILAKQHNYVFEKTFPNTAVITWKGAGYYSPCIYPISSEPAGLVAIFDDRTKLFEFPRAWSEIINRLEFPIALFDNYFLMVPGVVFSKEKLFLSAVAHDKIEWDKTLIVNKTVSPILLGEKDKKCYLIAEWNVDDYKSLDKTDNRQ